MDNNLWNIFLYYLIDLIKIWLIFWGILEFPLKKRKSTYYIASFFIMLLAVLGILKVEIFSDFIENIIAIFVLLSIYIFFEGKIIKKIAYSLLAYLCILFFDVCIAGIISILFSKTIYDIMNHSILSIIANSFNILSFSIIIGIKTYKRSSFGKSGISKRIYALLFAGAANGIILIAGLMITNYPDTGEHTRRVMLFIIIILGFAYFIICVMLVMISESRENYKVLSKINQSVIESQQRYYILANEKQQEIRSIRHDIKNHLYCIKCLSQSSKLQELNDYINQLIDQTEAVQDLFDTGNDIVNAILNDAENRYRKNGIIIQLEGAFPQYLSIAPMDLCVIFANIVSNAVEAIQKIECRNHDNSIIHIKISSFKEDLFIDISNPVAEKVEVHNGSLNTTKVDKSLHGFGTKNVKQRVEKYQGSIKYESNENMFSVHIHMKNE